MEIIYNIGASLISAIIVFGFMYLGKISFDYKAKKYYNADYQIEDEDNLAVAFRRAGLYLGIGIAMYASIKGSYLLQIFDGFLILGFLMLSIIICDKIIFNKIDNTEELKNKNIAVGIVEFGLLIGTGIIAYGSFEGQGPWYASAVFFVLGQALLVVMITIFNKIHDNLLTNISNNKDITSAILLSGIIIAYSLLLKAAVEGPFMGWTEDITAFLITAVSGLFMLLIFINKTVDKFFLKETNLKKELSESNNAALLVIVAIKIAIAFTISAVVI